MYRLTDENLNYIKKQYAKGISITAIAETFGIPRAAISLRLRQMGVTHKPRKIGITEQQKNSMHDMSCAFRQIIQLHKALKLTKL